MKLEDFESVKEELQGIDRDYIITDVTKTDFKVMIELDLNEIDLDFDDFTIKFKIKNEVLSKFAEKYFDQNHELDESDYYYFS